MRNVGIPVSLQPGRPFDASLRFDRKQPHDRPQKRGLSRAVGAQDRADLTRLDMQGNPTQHRRATIGSGPEYRRSALMRLVRGTQIGADHVRIALDLRGRAGGEPAPGVQHGNAVA